MSDAGLRALLVAALGVVSAAAPCAERPVDRLHQAILDAAANGVADPGEAAVSSLRAVEGTVIDVELMDEHGEPLSDCLARSNRPDGVSPADWRALAAWPGICERGDGEGRSARLHLIDLDGDGRLDLVRDTYVGGTGLFSQIELIRQGPDGFARPLTALDDADARDHMTFSINGRGADQAFDLIALDGRVLVVYRDSIYAEDTITLARPFAGPTAQDVVRVRYAMRHRVAPQAADTAYAPALIAAVDRGLAGLAQPPGTAAKCSERAGDAPRPWHGAEHYTFEYAAAFPVRHNGHCVEIVVVNLLSSYRAAGGQSCCMAWVHDRKGTQIADIPLTTERRVLAVDRIPAP